MSRNSNLSVSTNTSCTSLDSLFSRLESLPTISSTPVENTLIDATTLNLSHVSELIQKKIQSKTVVLLVGLPASGKSSICKQMVDFLNNNGYKSLIYNAGNIRRAIVQEFSDSEFFNPKNVEASRKRETFAKMCMDNMLEDFKENRINVGFLDATNTTKARRQKMIDLAHNSGIELSNIFILDVSCTDEKLVGYNVTSKAFNADYLGCDVSQSIADFKRRSEHYFQVYEPLLEEELEVYKDVSYLRIHNGGKLFVVKEVCPGDAASKAVISFVSNYYKLYGERYHAAVDSFFDAAHLAKN